VTDEVSELRHFLYLDDDLVNEFLAQLEEGELSEFQVRSSTESSGGAGGRVGLPVARIEGSLQTADTEALAYSMHLSPASRFQRLARLLHEHKALSVEPKSLSKALAGSFAIAECDVALTGVSKLALGFRDFERSTRFFSEMNEQSDGGVRTWFPAMMLNVRQKMAKRKQVARWRGLRRTMTALQGNYVPVICRSTDQQATKLLARLRRTCLRVPVPEIEGRARLLIKIIRKVGDDEEVDATDTFPGARPLTVTFRQGIEASPAKEFIGEMSVKAPAVIATAVAVYR
jgi:hypothetical protein